MIPAVVGGSGRRRKRERETPAVLAPVSLVGNKLLLSVSARVLSSSCLSCRNLFSALVAGPKESGVSECGDKCRVRTTTVRNSCKTSCSLRASPLCRPLSCWAFKRKPKSFQKVSHRLYSLKNIEKRSGDNCCTLTHVVSFCLAITGKKDLPFCCLQAATTTYDSR